MLAPARAVTLRAFSPSVSIRTRAHLDTPTGARLCEPQHVCIFEMLPNNPSASQSAKLLRVTDQLCSAEDLLRARSRIFSPSPPPKRRRGPGRGGAFYQFPLSRTLSPLVPRREREPKCREPLACRTELVTDPRSAFPGFALGGINKMRQHTVLHLPGSQPDVFSLPSKPLYG